MKKTYIIPEALIVELGTCKMMAESLPVGGDEEIENPDEILTKELQGGKSSQGGGKSVWDDEW